MQESISSEDISIVESNKGDLESDTGPLSMQQQRKRAASNTMAQHSVPKKWKGHGDYFFERLDDDTLKITGGDSAQSLTGGKSTVITDRADIMKILQTARGGDIVEEGVEYSATEEEAPPLFRGGGSPGLEYLNETESDFLSEASEDPEASQLDDGLKRLQATKAHKSILEEELPAINSQLAQELLASRPELQLLKENVDKLAGMGNAEGARMLAGMLVAELKKAGIR